MEKKKIKLMLLGAMDRLEQINATQVEKNKYKDKRRIQICNSTKLSKEQIAEVDNLYVDNYGKKIPLCWYESYTEHIQVSLIRTIFQNYCIFLNSSGT